MLLSCRKRGVRRARQVGVHDRSVHLKVSIHVGDLTAKVANARKMKRVLCLDPAVVVAFSLVAVEQAVGAPFASIPGPCGRGCQSNQDSSVPKVTSCAHTMARSGARGTYQAPGQLWKESGRSRLPQARRRRASPSLALRRGRRRDPIFWPWCRGAGRSFGFSGKLRAERPELDHVRYHGVRRETGP